MSHVTPSAVSRLKIVVVGGGFAGLAAAKTLQDSGRCSVTLLEASGNVGGRAQTIVLPDGQKAELGATWLHGIDGHPVYDLAVEYGLMPAQKPNGTNFWKGNQFVREGESKALEGEEASLASHIVSEFAHAVDRSEESGAESIGHHLRTEFAKLRGGYEEGSREADVVRDVWAWRELLQRGIDGVDSTDDGNPEGNAAYEELSGPMPPVPGGYQAVAQRMAEDLHDVKLNCPVQEIDWEGDSVRLCCANGDIHSADAVVLTVSLGVLKARHNDLFKPRLPEHKANAIRRVGIGVVDKIFITFEGVSQNSVRSYQLIWKDSHADFLPKLPISGGQTAIECCISESAPASVTTSTIWNRGMYSLRLGGAEFVVGKPDALTKAASDGATNGDACHPHNEISSNSGQKPSKNSAVSWISGHDAVAMEFADDDSISKGIENMLNAFPAVGLPRNFMVTRSQWGRNPYTRGSYSYVSAKGSCSDVDVLIEPLEQIKSNIRFPVVCFAGEATHLKHIGTTAGAYLSGVREAERIISALDDIQH